MYIIQTIIAAFVDFNLVAVDQTLPHQPSTLLVILSSSILKCSYLPHIQRTNATT